MSVKMENIGDIFKILNFDTPKRITFDLSEDGTHYNARIYIDIVDKSKGKEYEGYITCRVSLNYIESRPLVYSFDDKDTDKDTEIFTITIPDADQ